MPEKPPTWTHIIIHHSATEDGKVNDWEAIKRYHKEVKGWRDIAYHFGIELEGDNYIQKTGRTIDWAGAHCIGMNLVAIGICLVGDYDKKEPEEIQYDMLAELCKYLILNNPIKIENIEPHNKYAPKTCPGIMFDMDKLKAKVSKLLESSKLEGIV
jgi:N-acetylmuramoyl-L-alanine amidase